MKTIEKGQVLERVIGDEQFDKKRILRDKVVLRTKHSLWEPHYWLWLFLMLARIKQ